MRTSRLNPDTVPAPLGTYSHSVRVETADGTWIYVSGQIASDTEGTLVSPNDLPASTAVQVAALVVPDAVIEVDVVAVIPA